MLTGHEIDNTGIWRHRFDIGTTERFHSFLAYAKRTVRSSSGKVLCQACTVRLPFFISGWKPNCASPNFTSRSL